MKTANKRMSRVVDLEDYPAAVRPILKYRQDHPEAVIYLVNTDTEANEILLAMAAILDQQAEAIGEVQDKATLLQISRTYVEAVQGNRSLEFLQELTDETRLEIFGLRLMASTLVVH